MNSNAFLIFGTIIAKQNRKQMNMQKLIKSNRRGHLSYNTSKNEYHIHFGNIYMTLDFNQYKELVEIVEGLAIDANVEKASHTRIPFESDNLALLLTPEEITDLRDLMGLSNIETNSEKVKINFSLN